MGIIMDQQRCGPMRRLTCCARCRSATNVKVHELAAQIVKQVASSNDGDIVTPSRRVPGDNCDRRRGHGHRSGDPH